MLEMEFVSSEEYYVENNYYGFISESTYITIHACTLTFLLNVSRRKDELQIAIFSKKNSSISNMCTFNYVNK
jgi:hypothetical protein